MGTFVLLVNAKAAMATFLFPANYLPHRFCYLVQPSLLWTDVLSDGHIAVSYVFVFSCLLWISYHLLKQNFQFHCRSAIEAGGTAGDKKHAAEKRIKASSVMAGCLARLLLCRGSYRSVFALLSGSLAVSCVLGCGSGIKNSSPAIPPVAAPSQLTFTAARNSQSPSQTVTITRASGDPVTASLRTGAPFEIISGVSCTAGASVCQVTVAFAPTAPGTFNDSLVFADAANGLAGSIMLTGVPLYTPPSVSVPALVFGNEEIGVTSMPQSLTVSAQDLDPVSVTVDPASQFELYATAACTQGVNSCSPSVTFTPAQDGAISGSLLIKDTLTGLSATLSLNGTGYGAAGAMAGLDYYLPFTDTSGDLVTDASGNHHDGVISGGGAAAIWIGQVGLQPNDQVITIPTASGRATRGLCAYFPAMQQGNSDYNYINSAPVGQEPGQAFDSFYGPGDEGHGSDVDFPGIGLVNGTTKTSSLEGFSGIHCEEEVVGSSAIDPDHIVVDGQEVPYLSQSFSSIEVNAAGLTQPMVMSSATVGQTGPTFFSAWGVSDADSVQQAKSRTSFELARLTGLGVAVIPPSSLATDSTCAITGTSIDQGANASQPPSNLLALDFPCTIDDFAKSGQAPKDMTGGVQDREATVYHVRAPRNIAYNGGPTNGVINYLETAANAYQDIVDWNTQVHALGFKSIVTTMISRCQIGSHGYTGDQLKQQFNALLLANADQFDWVANQAAAPQLGADNACENPAYFFITDQLPGVHPNDGGQQFYVAAERAAFEGVYGNSSTSIAGTYTQRPSDRMIEASGTQSYTISLMDANTANFKSNGRLCVSNNGTGNVTLASITGQTVIGARSITIAPGAQQCIRPTVENPSAAGAVWIAAQ